MGYRIRYGNVTTKEDLNNVLNTKKKSMMFLVLGTVVVLVTVVYLLNRSIDSIIYPGDPAITKGAVNDMIKSMILFIFKYIFLLPSVPESLHTTPIFLTNLLYFIMFFFTSKFK